MSDRGQVAVWGRRQCHSGRAGDRGLVAVCGRRQCHSGRTGLVILSEQCGSGQCDSGLVAVWAGGSVIPCALVMSFQACWLCHSGRAGDRGLVAVLGVLVTADRRPFAADSSVILSVLALSFRAKSRNL